ncbi:hypothetical protein WMY93_010984 [Mugilogobius chulae]|uniref:Uncharacterized protein n=1 Tax=Mugilogobius chulae TaxID=88201 RepID=A0AAW0P979_9GOBI
MAEVILVAMHHTHNTEYVVPPKRQHSYDGKEIPVVHCLFHETKGLLKCQRNKDCIKTIRKEMGIKKSHVL